MRTRSLTAIALIPLIALATSCNDAPRVPTAPNANGPSATLATTPGDHIDALIDSIFTNKGNAQAAHSRWQNVTRQLTRGSGPSAAAKSQYVELVTWIQSKTPELAPPPGETAAHVAARLVLDMSVYVYGGPDVQPPAVNPTSDAVLGVVDPAATTPTTIQTPTQHAGVSFPAGAVAEPTVVVVTQSATEYPDNCSGPLDTRLCQYPQFYSFNVFPDVKLQQPASVAVCHVNSGTSRTPLADHDRFRLAHDKPADPTAYSPGSTIVDGIEILPLQFFPTLINCATGDSYGALDAHPRRPGHRGPLGKLFDGALELAANVANHVGRVISPREAFAIDQGGGGFVLEFSHFADIDPQSTPDRDAVSVTPSMTTMHPGDHLSVSYTVSNVGTATAPSVPATIRLSADATIDASDVTLATVTIPRLLPPAGSTQGSVDVVVPPTVAPGAYHLGILIGDDAAFSDPDQSNNATSVSAAVDTAFASRPPRLFVGEIHACALDAISTLYCWGDDSNWGFGGSPARVIPNSTNGTSASPVVAGVQGFVALSGGVQMGLCGIDSNRAATCWGRGGFGQLGGGTQGGAANPPTTVLGGVSWANINVSRLGACGTSTTGVGYCWGSNQFGEVGSSTIDVGGQSPTTIATSPVLVDGGLTFTSVFGGWSHSCGLTADGTAYCWGGNARGELGIGVFDSVPHRAPEKVATSDHFIQLSLGATYSCGITVDHRALCWGENHAGQLGDGTTTQRSAPTAVAGGLHFSYIATSSSFAAPNNPQAGFGHTCALTETGVPYCWGYNPNGQVGDGSQAQRLTPVPVAGNLQLTAIRLGASYTCGARGTTIWCWGSGTLGQLGNGVFADSPTPVGVLTPFGSP